MVYEKKLITKGLIPWNTTELKLMKHLVVWGKNISNTVGKDLKIGFSKRFDKTKSGSEILICSHKLNKDNQNTDK